METRVTHANGLCLSCCVFVLETKLFEIKLSLKENQLNSLNFNSQLLFIIRFIYTEIINKLLNTIFGEATCP